MTAGWRRFAPLLACPRCRGSLRLDGAAPRCAACGAEYAFEAGIPVLFAEPMPAPTPVECSGSALWRAARAAYHRAQPPSPTLDREHDRRLQRFVDSFADDAFVVDVGSGESSWGPRVLHLDAAPTPAVELLADAQRLPLADGGFDGVIANALLEHVPEPRAVVAEIARVLRPGGRVFAAIPFLQPFHHAHGTRDDYTRTTLDGLRRWFGGFEEIESGLAVGPASAVAWILAEFLPLALSRRESRWYYLMRTLSGWATFWIKYLDPLVARHGMAERIAGGFYFVGRKRI